ncbi:MAG: hypothetical protein GY868_20260, partial [Deltaproteobacteria bacterium]|nr:hypothetical protein [Deltaproteobacteria bacterium]
MQNKKSNSWKWLPGLFVGLCFVLCFLPQTVFAAEDGDCKFRVDCTSYPDGVTTTELVELIDVDCDSVVAEATLCTDDRDCTGGDCAIAKNDNCPDVANEHQGDCDDDGIGDACDPCPNDATDSCEQDCTVTIQCVSTPDGVTQTKEVILNDPDCDGVVNESALCDTGTCEGDNCGVSFNDNCPDVPNASQVNSDSDSLGDICDSNTVDENCNGINDADECVDADDDGYGEGDSCLGPDACDNNSNAWEEDTCVSCMDEDGDLRYGICNRYIGITGDDNCDDNSNAWTEAGCVTCVDGDDDGYYGICDDY